MTKAMIRRDMLARRRQLSPEASLAWSGAIQECFLGLPEFRSSRRLALYSPIHNEVATAEIFRVARAVGKEIAFPRVRHHRLEFGLASDLGDLEPGTFGILEPPAELAVVPLDSLDLLIVPGVAFDLSGYRLGYGKGFYDRLLHDPQERGTLVGLCYEVQLIDALPAVFHDVRMDLLVTEARVLRFDESPPAAASHREED